MPKKTERMQNGQPRLMALWLLRLEKDKTIYRAVVRAPTVAAARKHAAQLIADPAWEDAERVVHTRLREAGPVELVLYAES